MQSTHLGFAETGVADDQNMGIASQRHSVAVVHVALTATKQRQCKSRFHELLAVDGRAHGVYNQPEDVFLFLQQGGQFTIKKNGAIVQRQTRTPYKRT